MKPDSKPDSKPPRFRLVAPAPAQATEGLGDASAPAHATEGLGDASAYITESLADTSAPAHITEGPADATAPAPGFKVFWGFSKSLVLVLVPESPDEGFEDEPPLDPVHVIEGFKEQLVLVLASEPIDEDFEEEAPPDPVSGEFKEQLVLILVSEGSPDSVPVSGSPVGSVPVSEGSADSTPDYEAPGSQPDYEAPGSQPDYEAPGSKPLDFHRVSGGPSMLHGRPPDLPHRGCSTLLGWPPDQPAGSRRRRRPPRSLRLCRSPTLCLLGTTSWSPA
ncbi:hypothetical protein ILYODFUR_034891 [Ilyodon furcidens]|uniref:Uncharacterized protein n=1 Tax=Ilyodon furcidens TaxID=33524 RepID=A0ABV0V0M0_9TELE